MLRAAAFIKRLATFALSFGSAEAIAGLDTSDYWLLNTAKYFVFVRVWQYNAVIHCRVNLA
jgi:hypothetical protein